MRADRTQQCTLIIRGYLLAIIVLVSSYGMYVKINLFHFFLLFHCVRLEGKTYHPYLLFSFSFVLNVMYYMYRGMFGHNNLSEKDDFSISDTSGSEEKNPSTPNRI